jgi:cytochrome P450
MVEEALRLSSPLQMVPRLAREDVVLGGKRIRAGDDLTLVLASASRDEALFDNPDTFELQRAPGTQAAFGMGAHFCLGALLARLEGKLAFREFFNRFPHLELRADGASWNDRIAVRGLSRLPVVVGPR